MHLFFIIPWPVDDPLSRATVIPHLQSLAADRRVQRITLFAPAHPVGLPPAGVDVEAAPVALPAKVRLHPLPVRQPGLPLLARLRHHHRLNRELAHAAAHQRPHLVFCRGTAAIHGANLTSGLGIPYVAESFEPHAHYMLQTGTWSRWDPKFLVQLRWEQKIKRSAAALITVSHGYARHLQQQDHIDHSRLSTVPCWVDGSRFSIDSVARLRLRQQLGMGERLGVVYAGKFGGIYSPLHTLATLAMLQRELARPLHLLILTSHPRLAVIEQLQRSGFEPDQIFVDCVPHDKVADYLNAADLAVSFINSGPWSFACSAIKHGEAWACGLPLLMPPGVGDEAAWLEQEGAGAIAAFDQPRQLNAAAQRLTMILQEPCHRQRIRALGLRERSPESMRRTYQLLLDRLAPA